MIYFAETKDAPDIKVFKATAEKFIKEKYNSYINEIHKENGVPKNVLRLEHKHPNLEIITLTGSESISAFIKRYDFLKKIEFRIVKPNDEIDGYKIYEAIVGVSENLTV